MKTGRYFWGILLVFIGIAVALVRFDFINSDLSWTYNLWSLVFVFLGALLLKTPKYLKLVFATLAALTIALIITAMVKLDEPSHFHFSWSNKNENNGEFFSINSSKNEPFNPIYKEGVLRLSAAAGKYIISGVCDSLLYDVRSKKNNLDLNMMEVIKNVVNDSIVEISIEPNNSANANYFADLKFNPNITWDIFIESGASKGEYDFSNYKLKSIDLQSGAASIYMKIGSKQDTVKINTETGASSITFDIPITSGCLIKKESALSSFKAKDFILVDENTYKSPNYDTAKSVILIEYTGGVSKFEIKRY